MSSRHEVRGPIDATAKTDPMPTWRVGDMTKARIQVSYSGERTQAVWTVQESVDGIEFHDTNNTIGSAAITNTIDVTGIHSVRMNLSTVESTTSNLKSSFALLAQDVCQR